MEIITKEIDIGKPVRLLCLADLHLGDSHSDLELIKSYIDMVRTSDDLFCALGGDLMNAAIIGSKSDTYGEILTPQQQLDACIEIFEPIKDKILLCVPGNHEERIARTTGVEMCKIFATQLGVPYSPTSALLFLKTGRNTRGRRITYSIYLQHGFASGGRKAGNKLAALEELAKIVVGCDLYLCGHSHQSGSYRRRVVIPHNQNGTASFKEQLFVNTCSFLNWSGSYGDRMGFQPSSKIPPIVTLDDHTLKATVTM